MNNFERRFKILSLLALTTNNENLIQKLDTIAFLCPLESEKDEKWVSVLGELLTILEDNTLGLTGIDNNLFRRCCLMSVLAFGAGAKELSERIDVLSKEVVTDSSHYEKIVIKYEENIIKTLEA